MNRTALGLAIGAGYFLGRTKKLKMALAVGSLVAGKKLNLSPKMLADVVSQQLKNNPQFKEIGDQVRHELRGAGKAASGAMVERQMHALADRLHSRTSGVRDELNGAVPGAGSDESDESDDQEPQDEEAQDEEARDEESRGDGEEDSGEDRPRRGAGGNAERRGDAPRKKAAKKAPDNKAPAKKAAAKTPAKNAPAKKTAAKKTTAARKAAAKKPAAAGGAARGTASRQSKGGDDR
ncbi:DNA primase [Streptomyces sp. NPDC052301]|uniref:DNA primase n=1 Tax=Streptomyces sp. NPDC052301 TaxID=3365687 RepID=UPI0037CD0605